MIAQQHIYIYIYTIFFLLIVRGWVLVLKIFHCRIGKRDKHTPMKTVRDLLESFQKRYLDYGKFVEAL